MIFNKDLIQRATRMDFENYLPEDILVKVDRASMLNSLEIRSPMLDCNVIDFAFRSIPSVFKVSANEKNYFEKNLHQKYYLITLTKIVNKVFLSRLTIG